MICGRERRAHKTASVPPDVADRSAIVVDVGTIENLFSDAMLLRASFAFVLRYRVGEIVKMLPGTRHCRSRSLTAATVYV